MAGTRQRAAYVVVELEDSKPVRIIDARGEFWTFDAEGRIDAALRESVAERIDLLGLAPPKRKGPVLEEMKENRVNDFVFPGAKPEKALTDMALTMAIRPALESRRHSPRLSVHLSRLGIRGDRLSARSL